MGFTVITYPQNLPQDIDFAPQELDFGLFLRGPDSGKNKSSKRG